MRLYKRAKTWWISWYEGGVLKRISTHLHDKARAMGVLREMQRAQAQAQLPAPTTSLDEILDAVRRLYGHEDESTMVKHEPSMVEPSMIPLDAAWDTYYRIASTLGKLPGEYTLGRRKNELISLIKWLRKERPTVTNVESVSNPIAVDYASVLSDSGLSSKTRKNKIGELGTIWKLLAKQTNGLENPWCDLAPRITDGERGESFTREEEEKVLAAAKGIGNYWYEMSVIARHTGLRYGSIATLMWSDVHLDKNYIETIPSKTKEYNIKVTSPITAPIRNVLESLPHNGDYVFPLHAEMYGQNNKNRWLAKKNGILFSDVLEKAGITRDGITFHSWRHTFRTRLAEAGVDIKTAMELCGHTNEGTSKRYDHDKHVDELMAAADAAAK